MTSTHGPLQRPPQGQTCGHRVVGLSSRIIKAEQLATNHNFASSEVSRVSAGDRELAESRCPNCRYILSYTLKHLDDGSVENIGADPEVVQAALAALLAQPSAQVFAIDTGTSRWVLPRHHLPRLEVGRF